MNLVYVLFRHDYWKCGNLRVRWTSLTLRMIILPCLVCGIEQHIHSFYGWSWWIMDDIWLLSPCAMMATTVFPFKDEFKLASSKIDQDIRIAYCIYNKHMFWQIGGRNVKIYNNTLHENEGLRGEFLKQRASSLLEFALRWT